jgi:RNA-binding protein YhbY
MITERIKDLETIAEEIIEQQELAFISGSLGLNLQGIHTRREPKDIDIVLSQGTKFQKLDGMVKIDGVDNDDEYENEYYERISYMYKNIQVDIFIPLDGINDMLLSEDENIIHYSEIMKMKIMHAYGEHYSRYKHQKDIIHFMNVID